MSAVALAPCERCRSPVERGDLRCAVCGLATPDGRADARAVQVTLLRCDGCGATMRYEIERRAPACAFCGSVLHLETQVDPPEQTEAWLPFEVDEAAAKAALRRWQAGLGWFRPKDLTEATQVEALKPLWWIGWLFEVDALVSWTADSTEGARKARWAPHAGQAHLRFENVLISASRGLTDAETRALMAGYRLGTARAARRGPGEADEETFDIPRSEARALVDRTIAQMAEARVRQGEIPGHTHRNVKLEVLLEGLKTRRLAFPAYVLAYRYKGKRLYRAVVHAQAPDLVIGRAPYDWVKIALTALGGVVGLWLLAVVIAHL